MDHNDLECDELHYHCSFTILIFRRSRGSDKLFDWVNGDFKKSFPSSASDFTLTKGSDDEGENLEIMQHNPSFPADALIELFEASRQAEAEIPSVSSAEMKLN